MIGTYVTAVKTPCTALELAQAYEFALGGDGNVRPEFIAVLMAHTTLETGRDVARGLIATSCYRNNLKNIKASNSWPGLYTSIRLNEYLIRGGKRKLIWFSPQGEEEGGTPSKVGRIPEPYKAVPPGDAQTRMRAFDDLRQGVENALAFLQQPRFLPAWHHAQRGEPGPYVRSIHAQKYFTADLEPYVRGVESLYRTHLPVAQKIASEPLVLPAAEETEIDLCIELCSRSLDRTTPEHVAAVQVDLVHEWRESQKREPPNV